MKVTRKLLALLMMMSLLVGAAGTYAGFMIFDKNVKQSQTENQASNLGTDQNNMTRVKDVFDLITQSYYKKVSKNQLYNGAIQGMIAALNDPFSDYMDPSTAQQFNQSLSSSFQGIGAEVREQDGKILIVSPYKNSPADRAGLKPNDQIVTINGKSVAGLSLNQVVLKIRGQRGTDVNLGIKRPGTENTIQIQVKRENIPVSTVNSKTIKKDNKTIGIIQITTFAKGTAQEFQQNLNALENEGMDGLIIDVRGNPGGILNSVKSIADLFVTNKKPVVQIQDRNGNTQRFFSSLKKPKPYPIVGLIDGGSASAAEILAAALNEAGGYPLVGVKSFGKGTVQQTYPMSDGSNIKLTMFKWLTPDGNWIHKKGIKPTVEVQEPAYFNAEPLKLTGNTVLKYDMNNSDIANAQKMLKGLGFSPGRVDGYFGEQTETAVKAFQRANDLQMTGVIGVKTANKMENDIIKAIQNPANDRQLQVAIETILKHLH